MSDILFRRESDGISSRRSDVTDSDDENERSRLSLFIDRAEKKAPRIYNITLYAVVPLLLLICLTILFGHFLALLERKTELDSLHKTMTSFLNDKEEILNITDAVESTYENCIDEYIKSHTYQPDNGAGLRDFIDACKTDGLKNAHEMLEGWNVKAEKNLIKGITLDWNKCLNNDNNANETKLYLQNQYFGRHWFESYESSFDENLKSNITGEDINEFHQIALKDARDAVGDFCEVNTAGGAIFWFTIMTTIGYGNTVPKTDEGKIMVCTLGFITILIFTVITGAAGYVCLTIFDDLFMNLKMERFTEGWTAVLFWLVGLSLWVLTLAGIFMGYDYSKYDVYYFSYPYLIWWSFISVTTVGLGDIYIPHETISLGDMFYVPFLMLFGFVLVANFLLKLSLKIGENVRDAGLINDESLRYLLNNKRRRTLHSSQLNGNKFNRDPTAEIGQDSDDKKLSGTESEKNNQDPIHREKS